MLGEREAANEAWRSAVQQAEARAAAAEEQVEHLRAQVAGERQLLDQERESRRQADVLAKRARDEADRWRAKAEGLRVAWHDWRRALDGVGRWRLVRRKFPAEPVEFTNGPAIAAPVE
ncbi:MAG: hypothetical protein HY855_17745 [Burkholderiales bacterium]|nr:hypothetical protein [Burkholderiales bacterium]